MFITHISAEESFDFSNVAYNVHEAKFLTSPSFRNPTFFPHSYRRSFKKSNTTGVISRPGADYPSGVHSSVSVVLLNFPEFTRVSVILLTLPESLQC